MVKLLIHKQLQVAPEEHFDRISASKKA